MLRQTISDKRSPSYLAGFLNGKLPVLLFVSVFLLCHGMLLCQVVHGTIHLFSDPPISSAPQAEAIVGSAVVDGVAQEVHPMNDTMGKDYFAVLLLVAFLGLLLLKSTRTWGSGNTLLASGCRSRPFHLHLARGSPAPLLQVFRL